MNINHASLYSNISDLRKHPSRIIKSAEQQVTAIFNHGDLVSYLVPPEILDDLMGVKEGCFKLSDEQKKALNSREKSFHQDRKIGRSWQDVKASIK